MSHPEPSSSSPRSAASFAWRHRRTLGRLAFLGLLALVILQNVEPTSIDVLFWSLPSVPKLVLILAAMLLGAALWEVIRHLLFPRRG